MLDVFNEAPFENSITKKEFHTYKPYSTNKYDNSDEIRIPILSQDVYTLPCESYLYLQGKFNPETKVEGTTSLETKMVPNCFAFLFDEIRFEINGVEIDKVRDVGITSTMKMLTTLTEANVDSYEAAGLTMGDTPVLWYPANKTFSACIPLKLWMGFAEMYKKILINCRQELILLRARNDINFYKGVGAEVKLEQIEWHVPHINLSDESKIKLWKNLSTTKNIEIAFRKWELHEMPSMNNNKNERWAIRTSTQLEKPRYVMLAFQTNKKNQKPQNATNFDHVNLRNYKVYLNSECYPYDNQSLNFKELKFAKAYQDYGTFQMSYYNRDESDPILDFASYKDSPIFVIDCSKQDDTIVGGTVDIQVEMEADENFPANTIAYCLIIHDCKYQYNPISGLVHKIL